MKSPADAVCPEFNANEVDFDGGGTGGVLIQWDGRVYILHRLEELCVKFMAKKLWSGKSSDKYRV